MAFGKKKQVEDEAPVDETPEPTPPSTEREEQAPAEAPAREFRHDSYPP